MWQISAEIRKRMENCVLIILEGDYAKIFYGKNRDSDYLGDHRTQEFSRSDNHANRGEAFDLNAALGYTLCFFCDDFKFSPLAGYSLQEQHLTMTHGFQVIDTFNDSTGRFSGLNSRYRARWYGPWLGFDACYELNCHVKIIGQFQYHFARFEGKGHWNLRPDFLDDFHQCGWGHGFVSKIGAEYEFDNRLALGILATYDTFRVTNGRDRVLAEFLGEIVHSETRINEVNWHSFRIEGTLSYTF